MDHYDRAPAIVGATLGASVFPLLVVGRPLSIPMVYVALGVVVFSRERVGAVADRRSR